MFRICLSHKTFWRSCGSFGNPLDNHNMWDYIIPALADIVVFGIVLGTCLPAK
jgi:hypothetical protein